MASGYERFTVVVGGWFNLAVIVAAAVGLAMILTASRPAYGQSVTVVGSIDCGTWVEARETNEAHVYQAYVLGFLNATAMARQIEFWYPQGQAGMTPAAVNVWMDKYCRENPLSDVVRGTIALYRERSGWQPD